MWTLEYRRRVPRLSDFYRIHLGKYAKELHYLIPPFTFRHRDTRRGWSLRRHVVDLPPCCTSRFGSSFLMRTAKEWNALFARMFSDQYNLDVFKTRVNRLFPVRHALSSTASSLNISDIVAKHLSINCKKKLELIITHPVFFSCPLHSSSSRGN